jgi:GNAT superfamily N-acetyltransferase
VAVTESPAVGLIVREASLEDASDLLGLIEALALYEKLDPPAPEARERLLRDLFGPSPRIEAWLAEADGRTIGYALLLETYSSFLARPTLYLEDIFVLPEARGSGAGYALFRHVARLALERGCGRMEWVCLDWNRAGIEFYDKIGATHLSDWRLYRLLPEEIEALPETRAGADIDAG